MGRCLLLLWFGCSLGCGSTALINRPDGQRLEAKILSSSHAAVYVDGGRWYKPLLDEIREANSDRSYTPEAGDGGGETPQRRAANLPPVTPVDGTGITTRIPRSEIKDIDHPGNVAATLGALLVALGVLDIVFGAPSCKDKGTAFCVSLFAPSVLGSGLTLYGGIVHSRSVSAASGEGPEPSALHLRILPAFQIANGPASAGLQVCAVF
jgi:hypothetical protein